MPTSDFLQHVNADGTLRHTLLSELDRQRVYVHRRMLQRLPCPACDHTVNQYDAYGVSPAEYWDAPQTAQLRHMANCPSCRCPLKFFLGLFVGQEGWVIDRDRADIRVVITPKPDNG